MFPGLISTTVTVPKVCSELGKRALNCGAPFVWNWLQKCQALVSLGAFKVIQNDMEDRTSGCTVDECFDILGLGNVFFLFTLIVTFCFYVCKNGAPFLGQNYFPG